MDAKYEALIIEAKIRIKDAESELLRARGWLKSIEAEAQRGKTKKVSEGSIDTRTLLNG
jgi:hypothetical protein